MEVAACSAKVIKRIVEDWTNKEFKKMRVNRAAAEEKVGLHTGLIPLVKLDTGIRRCKKYAKRRISAPWRDK